MKQARELGINAQFYNIGVEGPDLLQLAGSAAEGLLYPYSYDSGKSERTRRFYDAYAARFNDEPDTVAANVYDAAFLIADCIEKVGNEVEDVKQCLYETDNFNGASGIFSIDENGDAVKGIFFKTVKNGRFVRYEQ
ncbi:MAG: branched-chain amino acid transport system substrate-binding protein [Parcubacteria group bacterium Greene0416_79]|nr:MAG: branched-chain amino acid transport system substrate-binding protein [Parcubacteria group bacterium Greene0416_79]